MLIRWNADGDVIATSDVMVQRDENGNVIGFIDFAEVEAEGIPLIELVVTPRAVGAGAWPEWLAHQAQDFRVEVDPDFSMHKPRGQRPDHRVRALVHKVSGYRRDRVTVENEIKRRIKEAKGKPADIRDLVGGPTKPLLLDAEGRAIERGRVRVRTFPHVTRENENGRQ
jgi:hypothetical protein